MEALREQDDKNREAEEHEAKAKKIRKEREKILKSKLHKREADLVEHIARELEKRPNEERCVYEREFRTLIKIEFLV